MSNQQDYIERYWRDATPADAIKEPPMVARFRNHSEVEWTKVPLRLMGLCRASCGWIDIDGDTFDYCQVYDAPDPGEGWRLVDVDKDKLQIGDEVLVDTDDLRFKWESLVGNEILGKRCVIRRRIEQPKPEPRYEPFRWEDREQLRGRWVVDSHNGEYYICRFQKYQESFFINSVSAEDALKEWTFLDTGEPVGRKVEL